MAIKHTYEYANTLMYIIVLSNVIHGLSMDMDQEKLY